MPRNELDECICHCHMLRLMVSKSQLKRVSTLLWRHAVRNGASNHQPHDFLLNHSFRRRSKKASKLRVTGLCVWGIPWWPGNSPHKWPVTRNMCSFDDVIMSFYKWFNNITLCTTSQCLQQYTGAINDIVSFNNGVFITCVIRLSTV